MKIIIYANVDKDWKERVHTPYGIAQFRSYVSRSFITSDQPYTHPSARAVPGDIIIWAFKDENNTWYLLGDGFVRSKNKVEDYWEFWIEGARLYPRSVPLDDLSFANSARKALNVSCQLDWKQYNELIKKAGEPIV